MYDSFNDSVRHRKKTPTRERTEIAYTRRRSVDFK